MTEQSHTWSKHHWDRAQFWIPDGEKEIPTKAQKLVREWGYLPAQCDTRVNYPTHPEFVKAVMALLKDKLLNNEVIIAPDGENGEMSTLRDAMCKACTLYRYK